MSYQGVVRDDFGDIVPEDSYSVEFNTYSVEVGGTPLWTETQSVEVLDGLLNVILGSSTALECILDSGPEMEYHPTRGGGPFHFPDDAPSQFPA